VLAAYRPQALSRVDQTTYDMMLRSTRAAAPDNRIAVVEIDDRSLAAYGQWPWRRDLVAQLIERLREGGASVIALDIVFAEADRSGRTPDDLLSAAVEGGRVVLGYGLTFDQSAHPPCDMRAIGVALVQAANARPVDEAYFHATGAVCDLPLFTRAAAGSGFLNAAPDADGTLRRAPLVAELNGRVYPSLALAAAALATNARDLALRASSVNETVLSIGDSRVPLDGRSNLLLRYRGGNRTFPYVSASDVLGGATPAPSLGDKIVFVGMTALGTRDVVTTPLETLFAGVEVQATVADNLLQRDFVRRSSLGRVAEVAAVLGLGGAVAALFAGAGLVVGLGGAAAAIAALWSVALWLFSAHGIVVSPFFPALAIASTLPVMTLATFGVERGRADRARRERTTARKLMVQALLSLTEVRDAETGRHSLRTQRYARILAEQLATNPSFRAELTRERIDLLSSLAPLHDIGKVGIPDHILNKPSALTAAEQAEMRKHPALGREVILRAERRVGVRDDETLAMAKDIVYTHHERWDGTGYPQGLPGQDVPLAGRIMAVVDVYDAATTRALYRTSLSHDDAVDMIVEGRTTHFDPAVVDAFVAVAPLFKRVSEENAAAPYC
jgi:adenylate cyclase